MNSLRHLVEYTESSRELVRLSSVECLQTTAGQGTWGITNEPCPVNLNWSVLEMLWLESLETPKDNSIRREDD
jgi:hypothetical protein